MEQENAVDVLQRYRRDRHVLLGYMLSGSLIKKVVLPSGAVTLDDVDLDQVSVDHVLNCAKKGQILDLSEAIRDYHDSTLFPYVNDADARSEFFMVTDPESSGSPPARVPPAVPLVTQSPIFPSLATLETVDCAESEDLETLSKSHPKTPQAQELTVDDIEDIDDDNDFDEVDCRKYSRRVLNDTADLVLALPSFATGITDDDLRETAFEILLAAAGASGGLIVPSKDKRKEKKSTLMRKLGRSKSEHVVNQSYQSSGLIGLLETMRVQMEISEGMDVRTRHALLNAMNGKVGKRMDTLLIPLELLCCISRTEFSDKKTYIKWQKRQLNLLEEGLINHPAVGFGESGRKSSALRALLAKIEESELLPSSTGEHQRAECLRSLREIVIPLAERPARGDLTGEVCHWADGYHLNVRLYEKLLLSVFDVLDEGKLTEEVEEILELLKSTWRILGVTETIHYTCYAWVLFRQFVLTGETGILQHVIEQLKKVPLREQRGPQERLHLKSLLSSRVEGEKVSQETTFLESFLWPIQKWVDKLLGDYHFHYAEGLAMMESTLTVAMTVRRILSEEPEMAIEAQPASETELIESYVSSSIKSAYIKIVKDVEMISDTTLGHPLALLAEQMKELLKKDTTRYMPILSKWHSGATVISSSLIHKLYGLKLKPFLDGVEHLTEDAVEVLPAAELLEQYVLEVLVSTTNQGTMDAYYRKLHVYDVESVSGTLVLRWVNSQLGRLLGWVERAIKQEKWVPVSPQQRHGSSIVEVYRIVEETVEQFFALTVPMRQGELSSLCRGIDNAFQVYAKHIVCQSANKEDIIPPVPILTRYSRENGINALLKKEVKEHKLPVVRKSSEINVLTTPMLCVQLNTLHYAISQLDKLEDSIWERWTRKMLQNKSIRKHTDESLRVSTSKKEIFNGCRQDINDTIDVLCEFTGTKIIFWDLREAFIENLYKPTVAQSRVELLIDSLDLVLNELCSIIAESLRDRVVTGLLQASLDGLLRVLLDGGPSRIFSRADAKLLEDDVEVLKEFFISGGDGLPRGVVENQIARVRHIIKLLGHETRVLIEDLKSASEMEVQGGRSKLGAADAKTLLRILCHRSDSEASQFVKKHYKIPKSSA